MTFSFWGELNGETKNLKLYDFGERSKAKVAVNELIVAKNKKSYRSFFKKKYHGSERTLKFLWITITQVIFVIARNGFQRFSSLLQLFSRWFKFDFKISFNSLWWRHMLLRRNLTFQINFEIIWSTIANYLTNLVMDDKKNKTSPQMTYLGVVWPPCVKNI